MGLGVVGFFSLMLSPQYWMLKCNRKPFHVQEYPGQLGKGNGHRFIVRGQLIS